MARAVCSAAPGADASAPVAATVVTAVVVISFASTDIKTSGAEEKISTTLAVVDRLGLYLVWDKATDGVASWDDEGDEEGVGMLADGDRRVGVVLRLVVRETVAVRLKLNVGERRGVAVFGAVSLAVLFASLPVNPGVRVLVRVVDGDVVELGTLESDGVCDEDSVRERRDTVAERSALRLDVQLCGSTVNAAVAVAAA